MATLRGDGNVLLPVDSAGRVLELLLFLDGYWAERRVVYPLVFLNRQVRGHEGIGNEREGGSDGRGLVPSGNSGGKEGKGTR